MSYTVKQLATLSGVTVRTLHYYDEIGLLEPARTGANGYRYYGDGQLLRLQQIMFFRELGMPLANIRRVLDDTDFDQVAALKRHRDSLRQRVRHTEALIVTIERTISRLEGVTTMADRQLFDGFDARKQSEYERSLVEDWGVSQDTIDESRSKTRQWDKGDWQSLRSAFDDIHRRFAANCEAKVPVASDQVQALVATHYEIITRFYTPDATMYKGLGRLYVEHDDFRKLYEGYCPGLAQYMSDAMQAFAETRLNGK